MAKQYKDYDEALVNGGKWTELVDSLEVGIYEIALPNYSALRSLQVIISRFNTKTEHKYKFTTSVDYKKSPLMLRIEVDRK